MKKTIRNFARKAAVFAVMTALLIPSAACGKKQNTETTAAETTEAAETSTEESSSGASTAEETTAAESTSENSSSAVTSGKLTGFLTDINENFTEGGSAGISLRAASEAADLMTWYMDEKPTGDQVMRETENFCKDVSDLEAFQSGIEMIYDSAKQTAGADGASLLSDAGWSGEVTWTEKDVDTLFNAIFEGTGQKK